VPPIPTPPETVKAPVDEDVDVVPDVTANPETDNIFEDGLKDNVVFEDVASPVPVAEGLKCNVCAEFVLAFAMLIF
jgi:hypothetical protein